VKGEARQGEKFLPLDAHAKVKDNGGVRAGRRGKRRFTTPRKRVEKRGERQGKPRARGHTAREPVGYREDTNQGGGKKKKLERDQMPG